MHSHRPNKPRLLIADSDPPAGRVLARMLREDGFDVDVASDGAAAIRLLSRQRLPDALVTDVDLTYADGLCVATYARSRRPSLPVLMMSDGAQQKWSHALDPEPVMLTKPIDYADLVRRLTLALAH